MTLASRPSLRAAGAAVVAQRAAAAPALNNRSRSMRVVMSERRESRRRARDGGAPKTRSFWSTLSTDFREAVFYLSFLAVFCCVTFGTRGSGRFFLNSALESSLHYKFQLLAPAGPGNALSWVSTHFLPAWVENTHYNGAIKSADAAQYVGRTLPLLLLPN